MQSCHDKRNGIRLVTTTKLDRFPFKINPMVENMHSTATEEAILVRTVLRASAMLKHVLAIGWTSVRLSVRPSVTRWYFIKTAEHIVMFSSPHDSHSSFVFIKIFAKFQRGHPLRGR